MRPHKRQPTRLPRPWDSPGKNTGVGCHFLLQCMKLKSESEVAQSCSTLSDPMDCSPPGSSVHGILQARVLEWGAIAASDKPFLLLLLLLSRFYMSDSVRPQRWQPTRFPHPWDSPGKHTGVGYVLVYRNIVDFCILILCPLGLLNSFAGIGRLFVDSCVHCTWYSLNM